MNFVRLPKLAIVSLFLILAVVFLDTGLGVQKTVSSGQKLFQTVISNQPENFSKNYSSWQKNFFALKERILAIDRFTKGYFTKRFQIKKNLELVENITYILPQILAQDSQKTYYILLQNNMELRPTGGFMGSYAKLKFKNGGLAEVLIQDIYVPDGQIAGHVEPPWPIQQAFKQGWWRLRDANWDPDFSQAAKTIDWFFQKGKEEKADGLIAINLITIKKIINVIGSLYLVDYNQTVDSESLYQVVQSHSEIDFFPGSTQKKDILSAVGKAFFEKIKNLKQKEILKILHIIYQDLEQRQILITFFDDYLAKNFNQLGWDGSMKKVEPSTENLFNDYLFVVETNLGANKANCCIERNVEQEVDFTQSGLIKEKIKIYFKNIGKYKEGIPPFFWGGTYNNFLRIFFPAQVKVKNVLVEDKQVPTEKILEEAKSDLGIKGIGFFVVLPAQSEKLVEINYEVPFEGQPGNYHLTLQKQPGIESFPYQLTLKTKKDLRKIEKEIRKDEEIIPVLYN